MIVTVKKCWDCPFKHFVEGFTRDSHVCRILNKDVGNGRVMPIWCPLKDMPVTVAQAGRTMVDGAYSSKGFEKVIKQIDKELNQ